MTDHNSPNNPPPPPTQFTPPPPPAGGDPLTPVQRSSGGGANLNLSPGLILSVLGIAGVLVGLLVEFAPPGANGSGLKANLWDAMSWPWGVLAIAAAVLTLLPALGSSLNLSRSQVRGVSTVAAAGLALWWVIFALPQIETMGGFLVTAGAAAAIGAVYLSLNTDDD